MRAPLVAAIVVFAALPRTANAQQPLAGLLIDLLSESTINRTASSNPPGGVHEPHFLVGETQKITPFEVNKNLAWQLSTFPTASSSSGFSYTVNPTTGEVTPSSTTFGPVFAERALTSGKGKFSLGFSFQQVGYDQFEGADLKDSGLTFILEHSNCCPVGANNPTVVTDFAPDLERDLLKVNLTFDLRRRTTALVANYGVTDRLDIGVAMPFVSVRLDAKADVRILRTATAANPLIHSFDGNGLDRATLFRSGSANGLGDISFKAKYNFLRSATTALAADASFTMPTGDADNLLGVGGAQTRLLFIASGEAGRVSPHANIGYTVSHGASSSALISPSLDTSAHRLDTISGFRFTAPNVDLSVPDYLNYNAGLTAEASPSITVGFDMVGRTVFNENRFERRSITYPNRAPGTLPTAAYIEDNEFQIVRTSSLNLLLGVISAKFSLTGTLLLDASVILPMSSGGLRPKPTPVIGLDYVF